MNPYTGHIMTLGDDEAMARALANSYLPLPQELQGEAQAALAGKAETHVDLRARGPLQDWAKKKRKEKIAAKSRRINRG
jgi:hypothetical protein